ncbi:hypothetical protein [Pseudoalteromonas tunicata]|uniref:Uncharacterized protein n=1 Tax=Pseudoalteromonas tunicata D2 TaxID=87626 RepID=A4CD60_9GAMM|nr:hypothetical protein [Pseudoalteromonas tunicata]ATC94010.1 hypothetical protein PTUN_a1374 [Pseudoalteromonas tunicata]AXT29793.1 hypothetical protein D1819_02450 [Pseudoalteromonas tunicata]EAR27503.1 hypothetical protein PTD2_15727 [Pseudoalteromonas tunicata D2]MDP4984036.1 hypothetical protein [Pseudoalteromonas tunicata]MDP5213743.1 hypothetical protein [Pseudoalteromonas tunicata]
MAKFDSRLQHPAIAADANADLLVRLQSELDSIQNKGISPDQMREALFQKMLDMYSVPMHHPLRAEPVPSEQEAPAFKIKLNQHGFYRGEKPIWH